MPKVKNYVQQEKKVRRKKGEGSTYAINGGKRWGAAYYYEDKNGDIQRVVRTGKTEQIAFDKVQKWLYDNGYMSGVEENAVALNSQTLVEDFVKQFKLRELWKVVTEGDMTTRTYENYEYMLAPFSKKFLGKTIDSVNTKALNQFFAQHISQGKSQETLNRMKYITKRMYIWACDNGYLTVNPFNSSEFVKPKSKKPEQEIRSYEDDEVKAMGTSLRENKCLFPVYIVMLDTGMRTEEAIALKWKHINFDEKELFVDKAITIDVEYDENGNKLGRKSVLDDTKTIYSRRFVPLTERCIDVLKEWKEIAPNVSKTCTEKEDFVFGNTDNPHWTYGGLRSSMLAFLERNGIKGGMRFHRLRHTAAQRLAEDKTETYHLKLQLGIKKDETVTKYLNKSSKRIMDDNREKLDKYKDEF